MTKLPSAYKSAKARDKALAFYNASLAHWPVAYESRLISTSFGEIFVMISGHAEAKPLVLLHGGGGNSTMWIYNIENLSQYFRVYSIDIIGEAGKSAATRPLYESKEHAQWLKEVFDALRIKQAALCGASLGGTLAHQFALVYPESVTALILLAPPSLGKMRPGFLFRAILANMLPTLFAKKFLEYISSRGSSFPEWAIQGFVAQIQAYKPNMNKIPLVSNNDLSRFPAKTLVLIGQDEILYNNLNDVVARIRSVAPHITIMILPDAKHMISVDQPVLVNEKIIHFLNNK